MERVAAQDGRAREARRPPKHTPHREARLVDPFTSPGPHHPRGVTGRRPQTTQGMAATLARCASDARLRACAWRRATHQPTRPPQCPMPFQAAWFGTASPATLHAVLRRARSGSPTRGRSRTRLALVDHRRGAFDDPVCPGPVRTGRDSLSRAALYRSRSASSPCSRVILICDWRLSERGSMPTWLGVGARDSSGTSRRMSTSKRPWPTLMVGEEGSSLVTSPSAKNLAFPKLAPDPIACQNMRSPRRADGRLERG
jgi:hypothetical protein